MATELRRVHNVCGFPEITYYMLNSQMIGLIPADYRPMREIVSILMREFSKCGLSPQIH